MTCADMTRLARSEKCCTKYDGLTRGRDVVKISHFQGQGDPCFDADRLFEFWLAAMQDYQLHFDSLLFVDDNPQIKRTDGFHVSFFCSARIGFPSSLDRPQHNVPRSSTGNSTCLATARRRFRHRPPIRKHSSSQHQIHMEGHSDTMGLGDRRTLLVQHQPLVCR